MDAPNRKQDQERSPGTWRSIRDGGLGFLISICVFAATAFIVSALLKSPFFSEFFDRDDYRRGRRLCGAYWCPRLALHNLLPGPIEGAVAAAVMDGAMRPDNP
jgi:hypothetical protein